MAMVLYCAQVDTWAKEAVKPSYQRVGIKQATDKANDVTHANVVARVRCKYDTTSLWCKYNADGPCTFLARNWDNDLPWTRL